MAKQNSSKANPVELVALVNPTCQQIRDQLAALQNAEILLRRTVQVDQAAVIQAQQELMAAQAKLADNLNQQNSLYQQGMMLGCGIGTGS